jgi:hypothetical protein
VLGAARDTLAKLRVRGSERQSLGIELERVRQDAEPVLDRAPPAGGADVALAAMRWQSSLNQFRASVDSHMLKQIDFVLVDLRNLDAAARADVKKHVATKWTAQQHRVKWVEP